MLDMLPRVDPKTGSKYILAEAFGLSKRDTFVTADNERVKCGVVEVAANNAYDFES